MAHGRSGVAASQSQTGPQTPYGRPSGLVHVTCQLSRLNVWSPRSRPARVVIESCHAATANIGIAFRKGESRPKESMARHSGEEVKDIQI